MEEHFHRSTRRLPGLIWAAAILLFAVPLAAQQPVSAPGAVEKVDELPKPKTPPPGMSDEGKPPLLTRAELADFRRVENELKKVVNRGDLKRDEIVKEGIRLMVHRLSMADPEIRGQLPKLRGDLKRLIFAAGSLENKEAVREEFRRLLLGEVLQRSEELLDQQFHVRLTAILIITNLNLVEPSSIGDQQAVPFAPAAPVLMRVLQDPDQHEAIKIHAAMGLTRILRHLELSNQERYQIASEALIPELLRDDTHPWYQLRLAEGVGEVDLYNFGGTNDSFLADALAKVMVDESRHPLVRAEAAKQIGRVPLENSSNVPLLVYQIVDVASDLANQQRAKTQAAHWPNAFLDLYLAFQPTNSAERNAGAGLTTKSPRLPKAHQEAIENGYRLILPLVNHLQKSSEPIPAELIQPLQQFLQNSKPADLRVAPGLQPVVMKGNAASASN